MIHNSIYQYVIISAICNFEFDVKEHVMYQYFIAFSYTM